MHHVLDCVWLPIARLRGDYLEVAMICLPDRSVHVRNVFESSAKVVSLLDPC
ncbi:hypothetical protein RMSM_04162 [Rhodopirellula maiorica SM1]|uniref:Uncharacterized protein n=1 Tax=Rhodopirellula maiorica SM1 TaxID=1265738 RepID=M5RIB0_9BACT|nr:hypothetical protein RMSM_04162 [Rhodopirellula maiorica SM1]